MKIGIVDADLLGRDKHRFPNLVWRAIKRTAEDDRRFEAALEEIISAETGIEV